MGLIAANSSKRRHRLLMLASLVCLLLGFGGWMLGNPDYKHFSESRYWFENVGMVFTLLGVIGFMAVVVSRFRAWPQSKRFWAFVLIAGSLFVLSLIIVMLECAFNFGDSDMPPFQPDTPFERAFDFLLFTATLGAASFWILVVLYGIPLLFRAVIRRLA